MDKKRTPDFGLIVEGDWMAAARVVVGDGVGRKVYDSSGGRFDTAANHPVVELLAARVRADGSLIDVSFWEDDRRRIITASPPFVVHWG